MAGGEPGEAGGSHVVVGVDGSGRTRRLGRLAAARDRPVLTLDAGAPVAELADLLGRPDPAPGPRVLAVDDAHRLSVDAVTLLLAAVRAGDRVLLTRRPTLDRAEVAELETTAGAEVELLAPLDRAAVAGLLSAATGHAPPPELVAAVLAASGGLPAFAVPLAQAAAEPRRTAAAVDGVPVAVLARVQRGLALAGPDPALLARLLALDPDLPDAALGLALDPAGGAADRLPGAVRALRDAGLLVPGSDRLVPVVAAAVRAEQTAAERRAGWRRIVDIRQRAAPGTGSGAVPVARACRAAGLDDEGARDAYLAAAEALRDADPEGAQSWLDLAGAPGGPAGAVAAALRAELDLLLGRDRLPDPAAAPGGDDRLATATAVADIRQGHGVRGGAALAGCGPAGAALAVPVLVAAGRPEDARAAQIRAAGTSPGDPPPVAAVRLGEAVLAVVDAGPEAALPGLLDAVETADLVSRSGMRPPLWPDTPHALTALVAVLAGDLPIAEHVLGALGPTVGPSAGSVGPAALRRHRLLLAWARLRAGRYDTAVELLRASRADPAAGDGEPVRERQLRVVLEAGLARRRGDVAAMRALWPRVEPLLARRTADLFTLEQLEELLVVAARLRRPERADPLLAQVDALVEGAVAGAAAAGAAAGPGIAAWRACAGWLRLQVAVALDDADRAAAAASGFGPAPARSGRAAVLAGAAACWAAVLADTVDPDPVLAAVDGLAGPAALPWEASQLAGQAAIRSTDPRLARRLLERARELSHAEQAAPADPGDGRVGALSEREVEVSRLVLAGRTHKEIGSQLYISAKTVEHHVARIRTKLGVQTRAEFVAALRALLADEIDSGRIPPPSPDS